MLLFPRGRESSKVLGCWFYSWPSSHITESRFELLAHVTRMVGWWLGKTAPVHADLSPHLVPCRPRSVGENEVPPYWSIMPTFTALFLLSECPLNNISTIASCGQEGPFAEHSALRTRYLLSFLWCPAQSAPLIRTNGVSCPVNGVRSCSRQRPKKNRVEPN